MDSKTFGELALQLLAAAQIPGAQIETAMAFKQAALDLVEGRAVIEASHAAD